VSGCPYNAAYYNVYHEGDGLGWHFDRSEFGVNLELQPADQGGAFEIALNTRTKQDPWSFDQVQSVLLSSSSSSVNSSSNSSSSTTTRSIIETITEPCAVGPGSLVIFSGSQHLHRVTPVQGLVPRINAIMTYEQAPHQKTNAYSLRKFFGRF
jgi:hypothetical protein